MRTEKIITLFEDSFKQIGNSSICENKDLNKMINNGWEILDYKVTEAGGKVVWTYRMLYDTWDPVDLDELCQFQGLV